MIKLLNSLILINKLNRVRDKNTPSYELRYLLEEITALAIPMILEDVPTYREDIETPFGKESFELVKEEDFVFIPILRAGLPMLSGALRVFSKAKVGFLAIRRDEETLKSKVYYSRLPNIREKNVVVLDPILATGGTIELALEEIFKQNPKKVYTLHIVASPEGTKRLETSRASICIIHVDRGLNQKGYIVPGIGDIGDRLFSDYYPDSP